MSRLEYRLSQARKMGLLRMRGLLASNHKQGVPLAARAPLPVNHATRGLGELSLFPAVPTA